MSGLAGANANIPAGQPEIIQIPGEDIIIELSEDGEDAPDVDERGNTLRINHANGDVTINVDGSPLNSAIDDRPKGWFDNLVEHITEDERGRIADDLLRGIDQDLQSRTEWVETCAQGIRLLGLTIEVPNISGASDGAPVEGMSKVRHPLLLEAVLRFQANARAEMLPTDGPVKIRNDDNAGDLKEDELATALEKDFNHYLTAVATEYYPDTDRMFLKFGFSGLGFKKIYFCPLRNRPVSETVDVDDLIVNNAATDLMNAMRVTHRISMKPSTVKRLQILGVYRDIPLSTPNAPELDSYQREEKSQQGISQGTERPEDRDREIYECYCELDIKGYEHKFKGKITGLEIPWRVTIDVTSREILSIVRDYDEDDSGLPKARETFVDYIFVPGFGFYPIGLLHILGNSTNAVTAAWREMLDNGMYANFPGFLMADSGARQNTNIFRVPPGGGALVKTNGLPIKDAIMPLPYQTQGMAALMTLTSDIVETGQRVGGTAELQVGEGKQDAPVGTTLALIEQATKMVNSVHKRMHTAQSKEFQLLAQCFREHPESFWQRKGKSGKAWDTQTFLAALDNYELVPQADPNTSSYTQRIMKVQALNMWAMSNPTLANKDAVGRATLTAMGWAPDQFLVPIEQQQQLPPEAMAKMEELKQSGKKADATMMDAQTNAQKVKQEGLAAAQDAGKQMDTPVDKLEAETRAKDVEQKGLALKIDAHEKAQDRESKEKIEFMDLARQIVETSHNMAMAERDIPEVAKEVGE